MHRQTINTSNVLISLYYNITTNKSNKKLGGKTMKDKIVLIVGSTSGIGKSMAELFAKEGAVAIVTGRREDRGIAVVKEIEEKGGKADFFTVDAKDIENSTAVIEKIVEKYGKIDVLIYNAGIAPATRSLDAITLEQWDDVFDTNLKSTFFLARKALPYLAESKGNIIFTSSLAGVSAKTAGAAIPYGTGKAGLGHMVKILALNAAGMGVRVNAVSPGVTMTDILAGVPESTMEYLKAGIPLKMLGDPEDIANAALFLASDKAKFITGQILCIDGGASIG